MKTVQRQGEVESTPAHVKLEAALVAVLIEKIASLPAEERDDLMAVVMDLKECKTPDDYRDVEQTINEILYPAQVGGLQDAPSATASETLVKRKEYIAGIIKKLRGEAGWTQDQLAERSGLPQSHISRLEKAQHSPSFKTLEKLAAAFEIEVGQIDPSH